MYVLSLFTNLFMFHTFTALYRCTQFSVQNVPSNSEHINKVTAVLYLRFFSHLFSSSCL